MPRRTSTGALGLRDKGDYDKAIADFTEAIRLDPKDAKAYCNRGVAYGKKREYDKAVADFTRRSVSTRSSPEAYSNRGIAYLNDGRLPQRRLPTVRRPSDSTHMMPVAYCQPRHYVLRYRVADDKAIPTVPRPSA